MTFVGESIYNKQPYHDTMSWYCVILTYQIQFIERSSFRYSWNSWHYIYSMTCMIMEETGYHLKLDYYLYGIKCKSVNIQLHWKAIVVLFIIIFRIVVLFIRTIAHNLHHNIKSMCRLSTCQHSSTCQEWSNMSYLWVVTHYVVCLEIIPQQVHTRWYQQPACYDPKHMTLRWSDMFPL